MFSIALSGQKFVKEEKLWYMDVDTSKNIPGTTEPHFFVYGFGEETEIEGLTYRELRRTEDTSLMNWEGLDIYYREDTSRGEVFMKRKRHKERIVYEFNKTVGELVGMVPCRRKILGIEIIDMGGSRARKYHMQGEVDTWNEWYEIDLIGHRYYPFDVYNHCISDPAYDVVRCVQEGSDVIYKVREDCIPKRTTQTKEIGLSECEVKTQYFIGEQLNVSQFKYEPIDIELIDITGGKWIGSKSIKIKMLKSGVYELRTKSKAGELLCKSRIIVY